MVKFSVTAAHALLQSLFMAKAVYEVVPARAASQFRALPTVVRNLLKLCDGTRTLDAICARSPLPVERTEQIVGRLVTLGLIQSREPSKTRRRPIAAATMAWIEGALPAVVVAPPIVVAEAPIVVEAPVAEPPVAEPPAGFSAEEESFFSSSIEHLVADEYAD